VVRLRQRRYDDALVLATRAEAFEVETGSPDRFDSWLIAAKALRALGRRKEAYAKLEDAMRFAEISREAVAGDEREMRYAFGSRIEAYMDLVGMLVDDGRSMEALEVAERAKGRTLLDLLRSGHLGFPARMTPEESKQDADLSAALVAANRTRLAGGTPAMADQDLARLRLELDSFRVGMAAKYPRLVTERGPEPLGDLSSAAATLPKGVAAFEYVVAEDRICAFRITSNGTALSVAARSIPMGREELARRVEAFSAAVRARDLESRALGADLARRLLSVQDESVFRRASAVLLIPDDALWRMPFEALVTRGDDYVGLIAAIVYTPSLTAWREMTIHPRAKPTAGHELIAFGNPRLDARTRAGATAVTRGIDLGNLPEAETEVHAIARVVGEKRSKVYVGNDVSEERAKRDAPSFNIVHFATHGVFDARNPMYSQIALGRESNDDHEDGLLEAWEIMQLRLSASLVVLSACDTARGEVAAGEGVVGMSWALFAAGSPTTLASQWRVSSAATERLMVRFYREWFALGDVPFAKAKAMQKARAALSRDNRYRRPYYWAPFVLIGSGQ
jgi:CHAT domain-containing protein